MVLLMVFWLWWWSCYWAGVYFHSEPARETLVDHLGELSRGILDIVAFMGSSRLVLWDCQGLQDSSWALIG